MHYELYIDVFFFTNFMMDSLLLLAVRKVLKCRVPVWRVFLGSMAGAALNCLAVIISMPEMIRNVLCFAGISTVMLLIGLNVRKVSEWGKAMGILFIAAFLMSGILQALSPYLNVGSLFFAASAVSYVILNGCLKLLMRIQKNQKRMCEVFLFSGEKRWKLQALIDTGNKLTDPVSKEPVHVIDKKTAELLEAKTILRYIPYRTVNGTGVMPVIRMEKMCVNGEEEYLIERPIFGICGELLSDSGEYQIILNADIF